MERRKSYGETILRSYLIKKNDGRTVRNNPLRIKLSIRTTYHIIYKSKNTFIGNAMNKTFQKSWMPHTPTEQPGGDHDNEDNRTRTEDVDCIIRIERRTTMALWSKT